ncbi:folylpolyglutamate synthase [Malassezia pachydermatis]|uniref:Folylpolyglutamate synthase n=1 Tax=Malassezia pachydermatis TaxID=77020 RepID=A0A0M9VQV8_9BASI|nr:folylpolyglutamate synthase [Malassezia pachydermatis]KOS15959.1 folylpolyglutamate synthase [Malassezia pachydermatis]
MDLGLGRVQALLQRVGSPHTKFPVIHVAGTNGKGSTTAYLAALLSQGAGIRSARFNSPHLVTARDSVRLSNGEPIDEVTWNLAVQRTQAADARDTPIGATPFELLTVQALLAYTLLPQAQQPEVLVIEVGVGGRLDATNVFPSDNVLASVICPIAKDHENLLGHGLAAIAREKVGILKSNGLCVVADQTPVFRIPPSTSLLPPPSSEVMSSIVEACQAQQASVAFTQVPWSSIQLCSTHPPLRAPVQFSLPLYEPMTITEGASSTAQMHIPVTLEASLSRVSGASTALQTLWSIATLPMHSSPAGPDRWHDIRARIRTHLFPDNKPSPSLTASLGQCRWEGRCEWHSLGSLPLLLDGAHNVASAWALRQYLEQCLHGLPPVTISWIMAFSQGKDVESMLDIFLAAHPGMTHRVAFVPFSTPVEGMPWVRSMPPSQLVESAQRFSVPTSSYTSLSDALHATSSSDTSHMHLVVVCGSLYLVSDFYRTNALVT